MRYYCTYYTGKVLSKDISERIFIKCLSLLRNSWRWNLAFFLLSPFISTCITSVKWYKKTEMQNNPRLRLWFWTFFNCAPADFHRFKHGAGLCFGPAVLQEQQPVRTSRKTVCATVRKREGSWCSVMKTLLAPPVSEQVRLHLLRLQLQLRFFETLLQRRSSMWNSTSNKLNVWMRTSLTPTGLHRPPPPTTAPLETTII